MCKFQKTLTLHFAAISMIILTLLLSGCATIFPSKKPVQTLSWPARKKLLTTIHTWHAEGAMAIKTPDQSLSAHFNWQEHDDQSYSMTLFGPLGMDTVVIQSNQQTFTLRTADGKTFTAASPEQLIQQQLGWNLPISNLYYWIRGLPAPKKASTMTFDSAHRLAHLAQQGWSIEYLDYDDFNGIELPSKLLLKGDRIELRIVVHRFDTGE
ncbi:MAG: outer membrane lipoprotein LolB [Gammaproteobacteria bacterium GWF2_41_13]|nr:MAG: outer membrane lipoprotein LolB [Gammaproteobacteria bacterium GWF2_41_13]